MSRVVAFSLGERLGARASASMLLWVSRTLLGLLVAYPLLCALEGAAIANGPERDAVLFEPGALWLLELVRVGMPLLGSALKTALLLLALGAVLELAPLACALDLLYRDERSFGARVWRSARYFPRFLALSALALATQAALLVATSLLAGALRLALKNVDERVLGAAPIALYALGGLAALWANSVLDLARAAVVEQDIGWRAGLVHALSVLFDEPLSVLSSSYASAAAGASAYLAAAWVMTRLDVTGPSGLPIALAFAVHQLAQLFAIAWRVRWLERALELSQHVTDSASIGD